MFILGKMWSYKYLTLFQFFIFQPCVLFYCKLNLLPSDICGETSFLFETEVVLFVFFNSHFLK